MLRILSVTASVAMALALTNASPAFAQRFAIQRPAAEAAAAQPQEPAPAASPNLDATWGEGARLVHAGVLALTAAEKTLGDATRRGVDAATRRNSAGANAQRASEEFRRLSSATPTSTDAAEAQRWAGVVQAAATQWLGFQSQERDATRDLNAAIQQNAGAEKAIEAALAQIDRGRGLIGQAQTIVAPQTSAPAALTGTR